MKLKYQFTIREVMGEYAIIPVGESALAVSGMIVTNAVGACLWKNLQAETTQQALVEQLLEEFDVTPETAQEDVSEFLNQLQTLNFLVEDSNI